MGRIMGVRGRPGLFFITILIIFLAIFFLTWKSLMTPKRKSEIKDAYSMGFQAAKQSKTFGDQSHSDINDAWHRAKILSGESIYNDENEREDDLKHSLKLDKVFTSKTKGEVKSPLSALLHATQQTVPLRMESKPYYKEPDESLKIIGGRMERFVHLDLKGAVPKISYLKEIFPLFSRLGATGLLIEYEDMFPYSGKLQVISAENSYTKEQIKEILELARVNSLQVIPLIQTFGHMEFILKAKEMEGLRESHYTPQVLSITSNASYDLVQEMVTQILEAHPEVTYLHIGCDEVYELGKGKSADMIIKDRLQTTETLFLRHVKRVAGIVAKMSNGKVRPIMWDDELRKVSDETILAVGLPSMVDIMVWRYTKNITDKLNETVWMKYGRLFKTVWAASSFKGATGPRQMYTEPRYHIINHFSWMDVIAKYGQYVSFKGIALTGWQRFDHFATLCELLPVAIPSLSVCLATIRNGGFNKEIHKTTSSLLGCSGMIEMSFPQLIEKERKAVVTQDCRFPGHMVYYAVQELWGYRQFEEQDRRSGWLSDYQLSHGFSSPGQLKVLSMRLSILNSRLLHVRTPLEEHLLQIYSQDTVEEWLDENIFEMQRQIKEIQGKVSSVSKFSYWTRRPHRQVVKKLPDTGDQSVIITSDSDLSGKKIPVADVHGYDNAKSSDYNIRIQRPSVKPHIEPSYKQSSNVNLNNVLTGNRHFQNPRQKAGNTELPRVFDPIIERKINNVNSLQSNVNSISNDMFKRKFETNGNVKKDSRVFDTDIKPNFWKNSLQGKSEEGHANENYRQVKQNLDIQRQKFDFVNKNSQGNQMKRMPFDQVITTHDNQNSNAWRKVMPNKPSGGFETRNVKNSTPSYKDLKSPISIAKNDIVRDNERQEGFEKKRMTDYPPFDGVIKNRDAIFNKNRNDIVQTKEDDKKILNEMLDSDNMQQIHNFFVKNEKKSDTT